MGKPNDSMLIIPHYNNFIGLLNSVSSIGKDENIDVLIVDDGSVAGTIDEERLKENFKANGTLYYKYFSKNKGIEHALNLGLRFVLDNKYKFAARLDCDDICTSDRFYKQKQYLKEHPEVKLLGSNVIFNDTEGNFLYKLNLPLSDEHIRKRMYFNAMIIHPTIMFCAEILPKTGFYPTIYKAAEDYAFLFKVIKHFKVANIKDPLVICQINPNGISAVYRKEQVRNRIKIILQNFYFGIYPVFGLLRNMILYMIPARMLFWIKKRIK